MVLRISCSLIGRCVRWRRKISIHVSGRCLCDHRSGEWPSFGTRDGHVNVGFYPHIKALFDLGTPGILPKI